MGTDRTLAFDYTGEGGFIASYPFALSDDDPRPLETVCKPVATHNTFAQAGTISSITWRNDPACIVESAKDRENNPIALVVAPP